MRATLGNPIPARQTPALRGAGHARPGLGPVDMKPLRTTLHGLWRSILNTHGTGSLRPTIWARALDAGGGYNLADALPAPTLPKINAGQFNVDTARLRASRRAMGPPRAAAASAPGDGGWIPVSG